MTGNGESTVSPASIAQRADALEKAEKDLAAAPVKEEAVADAKAPEKKEETFKELVKKEAAPEPIKDVKKEPNDPVEMRKWATRTSQENKKLRDEMAAIKAEQEKTYKLLASMSKKPIDYKELAKNPEAIQKLVEEERENASAEYKEQLDRLSMEAKTKDTAFERLRREQDVENYPEWKRLYPVIVKIAQGPTGAGDPRVDFTRPAGEILDSLYELALQESPKPADVAAAAPAEKVYKESEMKAMLSEMLAKEKDAIAKSAREEATRDAQAALSEEAKGGTIASAGTGAGRKPTDHLAAFKKMSLNEQREWLQAQQTAQ